MDVWERWVGSESGGEGVNTASRPPCWGIPAMAFKFHFNVLTPVSSFTGALQENKKLESCT
eukprot:2209451-Pyramimonas_sp.AAC.1